MKVKITNEATKEVLDEINYSDDDLEKFALLADSLDIDFNEYLFNETVERIKEKENVKNVDSVLLEFN